MPSLSAFFVALSPRTALYRSLFEKSRVPGIFSVVFRQPVAEIKYTVDNYIVGVLSPRGLWKMSWATPAMSIFSNYDWFLRNFSLPLLPFSFPLRKRGLEIRLERKHFTSILSDSYEEIFSFDSLIQL